MESLGYDVWWDVEILPGDDFEKLITTVLDQAKCVLTVWSEASIESRWVRDESNFALHSNILIPVLYQQVVPPMSFRSIHTEDMRKWKGNVTDTRFQQLLKAIGQMCKREPAYPPVGKSNNRNKWLAALLVALGLGAGSYTLKNQSQVSTNDKTSIKTIPTSEINTEESKPSDNKPEKLILATNDIKPEDKKELEAGIAAYRAKNYSLARAKLEPLAKKGNGNARMYLYSMYENGYGVEKDQGRAEDYLIRSFEWLLNNADKDGEAARLLGWTYYNGKGVKKSEAQAARWYRKAADQNKAIAQRLLGWMYQYGEGGLEQSDSGAVELYKKAAEQNDAAAQRLLVQCHY